MLSFNTLINSHTPWEPHRVKRVKFGVSLSEALRESLPEPLAQILVYIAQEGVTTSDLFRRPGNPTHIKYIIKRLSEGREVDFTNYNFYTLASVIKKFLLKIPGGVFGCDVERQLLDILRLESRIQQYDAIHSVIISLTTPVQHLIVLLFGTWFRIVNHSEYNAMSSESVAKSVAGSMFHTCSDDPEKVKGAVRVLQILIDDFGVTNMFGRKNIQYFADITQTGINVCEKYKFEYSYPVQDSQHSTDEYLKLFNQIMQEQAKVNGIDPEIHAITEDEFQCNIRTAGSHDSSAIEIQLSPSSPHSLQPYLNYVKDNSTHQPLTHVSSLSAPDVNQVAGDSSRTTDLSSPAFLTTSLSRFDSVRRRQLIRMRKRSDWFLSPALSGASASCEVSLAVPVDTLSNASSTLSDAPYDNLRVSCVESDPACNRLRTQKRTALQPGHAPLKRLYEKTGGASEGGVTTDVSPSSVSRYFMVQTIYGCQATENNS